MRCLGCFVFLNLVTTALCLIGEEGSVCNVHVRYLFTTLYIASKRWLFGRITSDNFFSRMESRYVPYTETYKVRWGFFYQTKTRTNYRIDVRERERERRSRTIEPRETEWRKSNAIFMFKSIYRDQKFPLL